MNILVGYKGGTNLAEDLLELALTRAMAFKGKVMIATVMRDGEQDDRAKINEAEAYLEKARARFDKKGVDCRTHLLIRGLDPGEDLLAFAREKKAGEIIIGVKQSRQKIGNLLLGATAQTILLQAPCPVVTMK